MAIFLVCMASLVLIFFTSYVFHLFTNTHRRLPPGPRPLPLIGNLLDIAGDLPHRSLAHLARRHGPLMTLRLGTAGVTIVASSPATAREVLQTHNGSLTGRSPPDAWRGAGHADNSVFVLPPRRKWRALRRIGAEHMISPRMLDDGARRLRPILRDAVLGLVGRVSEAAGHGGVPVEVGRVVFAALADLQWRAMFSVSLDEAADVDTARALHDAAREAVALSLKPNVSDFFPMLAAFDLQGLRRRFGRSMATVYGLIDEQIEIRVRSRRLDNAGGVDKDDDLLDVLLDMSEKGKDGDVVNIDRGVMRTFLADIFLATVDAVSCGIEWAMAELLQNPPIMLKLQEELRRVLGSKTHAEYSDMDNLPYLQAVTKETLRLHPVVPFVPNETEETVEIQGHIIPKGSTVLVNVWAVHRDAEVWPEPDKFLPERFLLRQNEQEAARRPLGTATTEFELIPFSAGRRVCLGMPLATRMLHAMLGTLLHRFEWTLLREVEKCGVDMSENLGLTMTMATPLQAIAKGI
uniref:Uncharacterized protein n=1 Tax=Leersia perrieri TaxID=77586 RepID=A0A0D9XIU2_9ORYZ